MAIYHNSFKIIQRSKGQSSVNSIAYRAAEKIFDERLQKEFDYSRKKNVVFSEIFIPDNAPRKFLDRSILWNENEKVNNRKDAQLSRETEVSLPIEFNRSEWINLIKEYVSVFTKEGMIADVSIHNLKDNPHAHIMLTMREVNENGFGKMNRSWNNDNLIVKWREDWSNILNNKLRSMGIEEISHKSHKDRGIEDKIPQIHVGVTAHNLSKQGKKLDRVLINEGIKEYNAQVDVVHHLKNELQKEIKIEQELFVYVEERKQELLLPIQEEVTKEKEVLNSLVMTKNSLSYEISEKNAKIEELEGLEVSLEKTITNKKQLIATNEQELVSLQDKVEKSNRELMNNFNTSRAFEELLSLEEKKKKIHEKIKLETNTIHSLETKLKQDNEKIIAFLSNKYITQEDGKLYISNSGSDNHIFQSYNQESKDFVVESLKNGSILVKNSIGLENVESIKEKLKNANNDVLELDKQLKGIQDTLKIKTSDFLEISNEVKKLDNKIHEQTQEYLKKNKVIQEYEKTYNRGGYSR